MLLLKKVSILKTFINSIKIYNARSTKSHSKNELEESCRVLGLPGVPSQFRELRDRFLQLAKEYHPDSQHATDPTQFSTIKDAYRILSEYLNSQQSSSSSKEDFQEEKDYKIKHTVPQHRHYLSYEGSGTPSQRQRQWNNLKAAKAAENVLDYRMQRMQAGESSLIVKDASLAREYKTAHAIERLVEDMIQQSMARGDFDNLPGAGKPLPDSLVNPYIDSTTHKLNQVLINNGFVPEWAELAKEIADESEKLRRDLLHPAMPDWDSHVQSLAPRVRKLNSRIDKYNIIVPILRTQKLHFNLKNEAEKARPNAKLPSSTKSSSKSEEFSFF